MPRLSKIGAAALAAFGWTSGASAVSASYLQVAGGGGGAGFVGGGGGAGGYLTGTTSLNPTLSYTVTVGAGGAGGPGAATTNAVNGSNSQFGTLTASVGGGAGGSNGGTATGANGGSGGGGSGGGSAAGGTATSGQGNNGGTGGLPTNYGGAGGGGAGAVGGNGSTTTGGNGGAGSASSITGTSVTYAGGGGGGTYQGGTAGTGGSGGGGAAGAASGNNPGIAGTANLGGGGGAASFQSAYVAGGNGGSGIVIVSYLGAQQFGGGVVTSSGGYTIHTFNTSGTLSPLSSLTASYLIVAGGGSGGYDLSGGGGAGGLLSGSGLTIDTNSTYLVTVGAGAAGATSGSGNSGSSSAFSMVSTSASGGGGGGRYAINGVAGASGGGAGGDNAGGGPFTGGAATPAGQGNAGGGSNVGSPSGGGGGGGKGAVGGTGTTSTGGAGGIGSLSSISGTSTYYAGGGGGGGYTPSSIAAGAGGSGGGGAGGATTNQVGTAGTANTGGGGGGTAGGGGAGASAAGGSGIVIISYAGATQSMAGGTVTISGGNVIHTFTSSGYLTPLKLVNNSLRTRSSANAYLSKTFSTAGNTQKFTQSIWVKRGTLSANAYFGVCTSGSASYGLFLDTSNILNVYVYYTGSVWQGQLITTQVFRDPAAWYHFVLAVDTTQATSSDRIKLYVNGSQVTSFSTANYPNLNQTTNWNTAILYAINAQYDGAGNWFDGYTSELNYIDGLQLTPNSFGTFNSYGVWQPITYGGSYGTNGFYLPFGQGSSTYAASFNGSSQRLLTSTSASLALGTNDFTVEYWVYFNATTVGQIPVTGGDGTTNYDAQFGYYDTGNILALYLSSNGSTWGISSGQTIGAVTTGKWYNVAITRSGSTFYTFLNGVQGSTFTSSSSISQSANSFGIGKAQGSNYVNGYISNVRVIIGTCLYTTNFVPSTTPLTAVTNTKLLTLQNATIVDNSTNALTFTNTGSVTTAVQYPFLANVTRDSSPAGNNWTFNNIGVLNNSSFDSMTDVPTLTSATVANYATINPLDYNSTYLTLNDGNLHQTYAGLSAAAASRATMAIPTTGKFYWEVYLTTIGTNNTTIRAGICSQTTAISGNSIDNSATSYLQITNGQKRNNAADSTYGAGFSNGQILQVLYDATAGAIYFGQNNSFANGSGSFNQVFASATAAFTSLSGEFMPCFITYGGSDISVNFGQQPFAYTLPTGYVALNTYNI